MYESATGPPQPWRTSTIARLLILTLAAVALALTGETPDPLVGVLGGAYALFTAGGWLGRPGARRGWLVYPSALADVAAITAFLAMLRSPPVPLWPLYVLPIAGVAGSSRSGALVAGAASVLGYLAVAGWGPGQSLVEPVWPAAVLLAVTLMWSTLAVDWRAERRTERAWTEAVAAARALLGSAEPERVAASVAEHVRRLVRADHGWVWSYSPGGECHRLAQAGPPGDLPIASITLTPELDFQLERGPVGLSEFGESFGRHCGEVVALGKAGNRLALLGVAWGKPPRDRAGLRTRLRLIAPWAEHALEEAHGRRAAREQVRREEVLRRTATRVAGSLDRAVVYESLVEAARVSLGAQASVVSRDGNRVLAGDEEVARKAAGVQALGADDLARVPRGVERQPGSRTTALADRPALGPPAPLSVPLGDELALLAWRADPSLDAADRAWLEDLSVIGRAALGRCATHEQLKAAEDRLQQTVQAAPAPIALWDSQGGLVMANAAYRTLGMLGAAPPQVPPGGVHEQEVLVGNPARTFISLTTRLHFGEYVLSLYREVTQERKALRDKEELIAMVGHELRTPLTSIQGYSQMMTRHLQVVKEQAGHLNRLIADLTRVAPPGDSHLPLVRERLDLHEQALAAAERFRARHEGRAMRIELDEVPSVEGDASRLGQVFDNLLDNAAKYSAQETEIELRLERDANQALISICDQGIGIAAEHLAHVFDRFYRAPAREGTSTEGLGLGLYVVRELVAAHGGQAWAESPGPGRGSTFRVALPAADDERATAQPGEDGGPDA